MNGKAKSDGPTVRPNTGRPAGPNRRDFATRPREKVSWSEINNQLIRDAIVAVCGAGAAIQLSETSDGGALSIRVYDGDNAVKEYPHTVDEAEKTLTWLVGMFSGD
jgi:hypothetical protein